MSVCCQGGFQRASGCVYRLLRQATDAASHRVAQYDPLSRLRVLVFRLILSRYARALLSTSALNRKRGAPEYSFAVGKAQA